MSFDSYAPPRPIHGTPPVAVVIVLLLTWEDDIAVLTTVTTVFFYCSVSGGQSWRCGRRIAEEFATKSRAVRQRGVVFLTTADTVAKEKMLSDYG